MAPSRKAGGGERANLHVGWGEVDSIVPRQPSWFDRLTMRAPEGPEDLIQSSPAWSTKAW